MRYIFSERFCDSWLPLFMIRIPKPLKAQQFALSLTAVFALSTASRASDVVPQDEYLRRIRVYQTVQPLSTTPFGENINLYTGELSFKHDDVVIDGVGPVIVLARETMTAQTRDEKRRPEAFGDWTLSVPRIETLLPLAATREPAGADPVIAAPGTKWKVPSASDPYARCSQFRGPGTAGVFQQQDWWHGYELISESGNRQQLLKRTVENTLKPSMIGSNGLPLAFPAVTSQNWQITCLSTTSNGEVGEGFLAISPDGTKYYFDHLVAERINGMVRDVAPDGRFYLQRALATMYVSKIEDRAGNSISYQYSNGKLISITASDGRSVSVTWRSDFRVVDRIVVQPAASVPREWRYEYGSSNIYGQTRYWLNGVFQPDGTRWTYTLDGIAEVGTPEGFDHCEARNGNNWSTNTSYVSTVTQPSGVVGTFVTTPKAHARSYVESACDRAEDDTYHEGIPPLFATVSLVEKRVSGPGLPLSTWTYDYGDVQGSTQRDACAAAGNCLGVSRVTITGPDSNWIRYTHSNRWGPLEGKLVAVEHFEGASTLVRSESVSYGDPNAGPYPSRLGDSMQGWRTNIARIETVAPERGRVVVQGGRGFTWQVASDCVSGYCFDQFARPSKVIRSSAPVP